MGALDWLSDLIGGGSMPQMGGTEGMSMASPPATPTGQPMTPPLPQGGDPMNGMGTGPGPGLPPTPPVPLPQPRPEAADGPGLPPGMPVPQQAPNLPPPSPSPAAPPLPPTDVSAASRMIPPVPDSGPQATGIIGRALGLDPNREASMRGALGAGLKAAGENAHKPGLAAFAGSMGSGIEGGKGATDKTTEQQDKFLQRKIAANAAANTTANGQSTRDLNVARTQLALAQAKQAMAGGKESVVNSDQQLYLRADKQALAEAQVSANGVKQALANAGGNVDDPTYKKVLDAHNATLEALKAQQYQKLGLDPKKAAKIAKQPGMSAENPIDPKKDKLTQEKLNALPPGTHVVGPDGKVLVKQAPAGGNQPTTAQQQMTPSVPPTPPVPPVTAPAGSRADTEDED